MAAILTVQDLHKRFGRRVVLEGVSLAVHERDRIGLIGRNGGGKSTLMKMIVAGAEAGAGVGVSADEAAQLIPDEGLITWKRELSLEYVAQEPIFDADATVEFTLDRGPEIPAHEVHTIAAALALPPSEKRMGTLSIGERRRVALARALLGRADLLALDEPTNHLDARTVEWLEGRLAALPGALLLVTHDRYFLDRVATRIIEIDRGKAYSYDGDYTTFLERQAERIATEDERERQRASFVRNELDWIRRGPQARGTKAKARIGRFETAVAAKATVDHQLKGAIALSLPTGGRLGNTILELHKVGRTIGGKKLFSDLTLTMKPGERIGIVGPNGAGKTTLIRTLLGVDPPDSGKVVVGQNTTVAYLEQGRTELRDDLTVLEEVAEGNAYVYLEDGPMHVRSFLKLLQFSDATADTQIRLLSGGERNRVQLARLLRRGGNLLVLDEPTNDLDLLTLGALEEALVNFPACALIVSHDRWFLDRVATGILAFEGDGQVTFYEGDYSSYQAKRAQSAAKPNAAAPTTNEKPRAKTQSNAPSANKARKLSFKEARELETIEATIAEAEAKVAELEISSTDPALFKGGGGKVAEILAQLEASRAEVERLFARWQELEAIAAAAPPS